MYNWNQFRNIPKFKGLPPQEQARQYFIYQSNMMIEQSSNSAAIAPAAAASSAGGSIPQAPIYAYAVSGPNMVSSLYRINLQDGTYQLIGSTGRDYFTGLASKSDGTLYGVTNPPAGRKLWTIDVETGASTLIGTTNNQIPDITMVNDSFLVGWSESDDWPVSLDMYNGSALDLTPNTLSTYRTGIANGPDSDTVLVNIPDGLYQYSLIDGSYELLATLEGLPDAGDGESSLSNGIANWGNKLIGMQRVSDGEEYSSTRIFSFDESGSWTLLCTVGLSLSGITVI